MISVFSRFEYQMPMRWKCRYRMRIRRDRENCFVLSSLENLQISIVQIQQHLSFFTIDSENIGAFLSLTISGYSVFVVTFLKM